MFLLRPRTLVSLFAIATFLTASMELSSSAFAKGEDLRGQTP